MQEKKGSQRMQIVHFLDIDNFPAAEAKQTQRKSNWHII